MVADAHTQGEDGRRAFRRVRPDGSDEQVLYAFDSGDNSMPHSGYGLQWVPGEVDRIIYTGNNDQAYVLGAR